MRAEAAALRALLPVLVLAAGCFSPQPKPAPVLLGPDVLDRIDLDEMLEAGPVEPGEALRVSAAGRTDTTSLHVVQIRTQEQPHLHADHDLVAHIVRGHGIMYRIRMTSTAFSVSIRSVSKGDSMLIPRGTVHWFVNESPVPAVALAGFSPPLTGRDVVPAPEFLVLQQLPPGAPASGRRDGVDINLAGSQELLDELRRGISAPGRPGPQ